MKKAFTLIEILLYLGILTIVISAIIPFTWMVIMTGQKSTVQQEVFNNARYVSEILKRQIRNARSINSFDSTNNSTVTLLMPDNTLTTVNLDAGKVKINGTPLNSSGTKVSSLVFENYSSGRARNLGFTLIMTGVITSGSKTYQATTTIKSGAEMRN